MNAKRKLILIVDDADDVRQLIKLSLRAYGYQLVEARNGAEAIRITKHRKPDMVLLDLHMPEMDGWEFLKEFRSDKENKAVPVVILTAYGGLKNRTKALLTAGATAFIKKPFTPKEIRAVARNVLD